MAKKFVRGITGVDDIEKLDKTLTNVNDLVSDGQNTYVHTKKGKNEFYYKVTDGVTSIQSTGNTINVEKSDNGAVTLNTNPQKVLEHDNLLADYGIKKTTSGNTTKLGVEYTRVSDGFDLNKLTSGFVRGNSLTNAPTPTGWYFVETFSEGAYSVQKAIPLNYPNTPYLRLNWDGEWTEWREQVADKSTIDTLLAQKQNTLSNNASVGVVGTGLRQLYALNQTYSHTNGVLKTHVKSIALNTSPTKNEEEFNFIVKINKGATSAMFTLNEHDKTKFTNIMINYGQNNSVRISGLIFTLSGSNLTVTTANTVNHDYVVTFSDII